MLLLVPEKLPVGPRLGFRYALVESAEHIPNSTRFLIEHECRERLLWVHAECCPDHAAELVREIGGKPSGTRIEDRQQKETWQSVLGATSERETEREGEA